MFQGVRFSDDNDKGWKACGKITFYKKFCEKTCQALLTKID